MRPFAFLFGVVSGLAIILVACAAGGYGAGLQGCIRNARFSSDAATHEQRLALYNACADALPTDGGL